jgi:hypothetical protein
MNSSRSDLKQERRRHVGEKRRDAKSEVNQVQGGKRRRKDTSEMRK